MSSTKSIIATAVLAGCLATSATSTARADTANGLVMKPLDGQSFDVGSKHAVGYFTSEKGTCKLVVTMADEPDWSQEVVGFLANRFEATVPAGKAARLSTGDGGSIDFKCQSGAEAMIVNGVKRLSASKLR